jgi:hypothetical protein
VKRRVIFDSITMNCKELMGSQEKSGLLSDNIDLVSAICPEVLRGIVV